MTEAAAAATTNPLGSGDAATTETTETPQSTNGIAAESAVHGEPWTKEWSDDLKTLATQKGWKNPMDAAKAYQHAQKMLGAPPERILKLPTDAADATWNDIWNRLGRPDSPDGYDFGEIKQADGEPDLLTPFRSKAHELGLTQSQAKGIQEWHDALVGQINSDLQAQAEADRITQMDKDGKDLKTLWGKEYDASLLRAKVAAKHFGLDADALVEKLGLKESAVMLERIGRALGEATMTSLAGNGGTPIGSPGWAQSEIAKLRNDETFMKTYRSGDGDARRRLDDLYAKAYPE